MQKIKFEDRAVAFIDVLGFKQVVDAACQGGSEHAELEALINVLESAVPKMDGTVDPSVPKDLIPKHIYISDCIILSAPLTSSEMPSYRGLSILVMRVIQVSHIFAVKRVLAPGRHIGRPSLAYCFKYRGSCLSGGASDRDKNSCSPSRAILECQEALGSC